MSPEEEARLLAAVKRTRMKISDAKIEQQNAVSAALEAGVSGSVIAQVLGVTRHRVYQIRDGK